MRRRLQGAMRRDSWIALLALGGVSVLGCKRSSSIAADAGADHAKNCAQIVVELGQYKGKPLGYDDSMAEIARLKARADAGILECIAARDDDAVKALQGVKQQLAAQEQAAINDANRQNRRASTNDTAPLDPASCPKGKVVIDAATGKTIQCTGDPSVATTAATGDDADVRSTCARVKQTWMNTDGIDPIITCTGEGASHEDVKIVVTAAGWDYLGTSGKRHAFATSILDAYRPHWKTFHGWNGGDPSGKQVHVWRASGADVTLAATTSAGGLYLE